MTDVWVAKKRNYECEKYSKSERVVRHPLESLVVTYKNDLDDTNTSAGRGDRLYDPLSRIADEAALIRKKEVHVNLDDLDPLVSDTWSSRRKHILQKYTTNEKLNISSNFLKLSNYDTTSLSSTDTQDKLHRRLEQLDDLDDGCSLEKQAISQQDFISRIEEQLSSLRRFWSLDHRVKALKITIQCAKLLADVNVIQFYPSKFVLITDVLDCFGKLVFERIKSKSFVTIRGKTQPLPDDFDESIVPDIAKETCRNWIYKISSIRELLPRFYVETSILSCWRFFTIGEYKEILLRLTKMIRGISNPLVATYARCYLCRVGRLVADDIKQHLMPCYDDYLFTYTQLASYETKLLMSTQRVTLSEYYLLFSPALDWMITCISTHSVSSGRTLLEVLKRSKRKCHSTMLMDLIIKKMPSQHCSDNCLLILNDYLNSDCVTLGVQRIEPLISLGDCCNRHPPPTHDNLAILNHVWKFIRKLESPLEYIKCVEAWIDFVVFNFTMRELITVLKDINKHMKDCTDHRLILIRIMKKILLKCDNIADLIVQDEFLQCLQLFQDSADRVDVMLCLMNTFQATEEGQIQDNLLIETLFQICKYMHDSTDSTSLKDHKLRIGLRINEFIREVWFGRDLEAQLSFYVRSRAAFSNFDNVLVQLIHSVNILTMKTRTIMKAKHSKKTSEFVRACVAYTFITIPSLVDVASRLNLYVISGRVALINGCLSQGDAFTKAAINLVLEVSQNHTSIEPNRFIECVNNLLSDLLVVPDNPELGILSPLLALLNILRVYPWQPGQLGHVYVHVLVLLAATSQHTFIYSIDNVESNETLYGNDDKYIEQVNEISKTLMQNIITEIDSIKENKDTRDYYSLVLHLLNSLIGHADLNSGKTRAFIETLWRRLVSSKEFNTKAMMDIHSYLKSRGDESSIKLTKLLKLESTM